jgi:hypothetical protein
LAVELEEENGVVRRKDAVIPADTSQPHIAVPDDPQCDAVKLIRIALWRERRHTEKLLNGLFAAVNTEIGLLEERTLAKLEDVDNSVSLIAGELARRSNDPPPGGAAS